MTKLKIEILLEKYKNKMSIFKFFLFLFYHYYFQQVLDNKIPKKYQQFGIRMYFNIINYFIKVINIILRNDFVKIT